MDIQEAKSRINVLARAIRDSIQQFESDTGFTVEHVDLTHDRRINGARTVVHVDVKAWLISP